MHHQFGGDEYRQCNQESDVRLNVVQEGDLDGATQGVSLDQRQKEERQPREERDYQDSAAQQFQCIPGEMSAPVELK